MKLGNKSVKPTYSHSQRSPPGLGEMPEMTEFGHEEFEYVHRAHRQHDGDDEGDEPEIPAMHIQRTATFAVTVTIAVVVAVAARAVRRGLAVRKLSHGSQLLSACENFIPDGYEP